MADYEPLDLSAVLNLDASSSLLAAGPPPAVGALTLRGLPFSVGPDDPAAAAPRFLACGGEWREPVRLPVGRAVQSVVVAHRLLDSDLGLNGPVGVRVADYLFQFDDAEPLVVPIRERFEIGVVPPAWGQLAFLAWPDQPDRTPPRESGRWGDAGQRQTDVVAGWPRSYYLWVWRSPRPDAVLEAIEVRPAGPRFLIAGITLGHLDEDPVPRTAGVPVVVEAADDTPRRGAVALEVDRGEATFAYPLPAQPIEEFLSDPLAGFGQASNEGPLPAVAHVTAAPSATLTVKHGDEALGQVRWGDVTADGAAAGKVRVRLADTGRNWVHTRVIDADSGETLPCRIHFRSPEGIPYQPHGHHNEANRNLGSWHQDVGGDVRLGQITYAYIDGTCQGWLPRGRVLVDVACGFEYEPLRTGIELAPGQRELTLKLKRLRDMNAEGWYSGDSHVHFLSTQGAHTEAAGEGLNVVNLLLSQWGHLFTNTEEFTGEASVRAGRRTIVYASQENRQHLLGHLTLLGLKEPVMPWCSDGPSEAELTGNLETTLARWADACHAQGGTVVLPHIPNPNGEPAALIASGRVDAVEFLTHDAYATREYYRYLNAGYRLPLVGGTDKMTSDVPVGLYRTYVRIPDDEPFTYESWCRHLAGGNTFQTGGPLLHFTVDGRMPGSMIKLPGNGGTVTVRAVADSIFPIEELQIVRQGRVVASVEGSSGARRLALEANLTVDAHTWLAARVSGRDYTATPHHDGWHRGIMAHTSPVYLAVGGEYALFDRAAASYMLTLIDGSVQYIRRRARQYPNDAERVTHAHDHRDHVAWLEEPFHEAAAAIHRRMHQLGIEH